MVGGAEQGTAGLVALDPLGAQERAEGRAQRVDLGERPRPLARAAAGGEVARAGAAGGLRFGLRIDPGLAEDAQGHLHAAADEDERRGHLGRARFQPDGERVLVRESLAEAGGEDGAEAAGEPAHHGVLALQRLAVGSRTFRDLSHHGRDRAGNEAQCLAGDPFSERTAGLLVHQRVEIDQAQLSAFGRTRSAAQRRADRRR